MAIKINYRGIEFTVSSTGEAVALANALTETTQVKPGRPAKPLELFPSDNLPKLNQLAVAYLNAIASAGANGATANDLAPVLELRHPKGVGTRASRIDKLLNEMGIMPDDVYSNTKTSDGRFWKPRHRIQEAIEKLKTSA
jgi:hypothetical protein